MAAVGEYTVDVESVGKASEVLKEYATDLKYPGEGLTSVKVPAEPKAGVSVVAAIKSSTSAWNGVLAKVSTEMNGLATMCGDSATLYHETEDTVTRTFRPGNYGKFAE